MIFVEWSARRIVLGVIFVVFLAIATSATALAEGFDKPVREVQIDLGSSPDQLDFPNLHRHLSCYYFPHFMVKQFYDDGNKGALRISVLRIQGSQAPTCTQSLRRFESVVPKGCNYYWGVKNELLFLIDCDGEGEAQYFDVFNAGTLNHLLRDALRFDTLPNFGHAMHGHISMRYEKIFYAKCSLMDKAEACWQQISAQMGLRKVPIPKCTGYDLSDPRDKTDPSLIGYPVEVILTPKPARKNLPGSVDCFAAQ